MSPREHLPLLALLLPLATGALGCPKATSSDVAGPATTSASKPRPGGGGPSVRSEVGALDEDAVKALVKAAFPTIDRCVAGRRKKLPYLGGTVDVVVRSDSQGKVRWAHVSDSTLGDRDTELCILDALSAQTWPTPEGGDDGETRQRIDLGTTDEREPTPWSVADLSDAGGKLEAALAACRRSAGTAALSVTFFVDPSGSARTVGVASADEKGVGAVDCAIAAVKALTYPTPGSYPAKVTVEVR